MKYCRSKFSTQVRSSLLIDGRTLAWSVLTTTAVSHRWSMNSCLPTSKYGTYILNIFCFYFRNKLILNTILLRRNYQVFFNIIINFSLRVSYNILYFTSYYYSIAATLSRCPLHSICCKYTWLFNFSITKNIQYLCAW